MQLQNKLYHSHIYGYDSSDDKYLHTYSITIIMVYLTFLKESLSGKKFSAQKLIWNIQIHCTIIYFNHVIFERERENSVFIAQTYV